MAKDKEIKQEPIHKIQTKKYREQPKKNNNCGFCGQQNLTPGKNGEKQQLSEIGTLCTGLPQQKQQ